MEIHIEGLDSVRDMLNERAEQIAANIAKGVAEAGELVKGAAKDLAPVKSGALRDSITSEADGNTAIVGTNIEYGIYVEFGTGVKEIRQCRIRQKKSGRIAVTDNFIQPRDSRRSRILCRL